jgi:hypothetical protein
MGSWKSISSVFEYELKYECLDIVETNIFFYL